MDEWPVWGSRTAAIESAINGRFGPFVPLAYWSGRDFANVANCALLPLMGAAAPRGGCLGAEWLLLPSRRMTRALAAKVCNPPIFTKAPHLSLARSAPDEPEPLAPTALAGHGHIPHRPATFGAVWRELV